MTKALSEFNPGERFAFGGIDWVKLDEQDGAALCLAAECVTEKAFDEGNCNDWRKSTLREWLNSEEGFFGKLSRYLLNKETTPSDQFMSLGGAFLPVTSDLTADDGMTDYGTSTDTIALITCDQYRKYRGVIPNIDAWWWTITPWSCLASHSFNARIVNTSGALNYSSAYYGSMGVRPLCRLKSEILVSEHTAPQEEPDARKYTKCAYCGGEIRETYWREGEGFSGQAYCSEDCIKSAFGIDEYDNVKDEDE